MTLAKGKITQNLTAWDESTPVLLYTADTSIRITYMQFVSEHSANVTINLFINYLDGTVYSLPKDTLSKVENKTIIQFDVLYSLLAGETVTATVDVGDVINYIVEGEAI